MNEIEPRTSDARSASGTTATKRHRLGPAVVTSALLLASVPVIAAAHPGHPPQTVKRAPVSVKTLSMSTLEGDVDFSAKGPSEMALIRVTVRRGESIGWHSHSGPVLVAVKRGTATSYVPDGTGCVRKRFHAGDSSFENAGDIHTVHNEGKGDLVFYAISLFPKGSPSGNEEQAPADCPT